VEDRGVVDVLHVLVQVVAGYLDEAAPLALAERQEVRIWRFFRWVEVSLLYSPTREQTREMSMALCISMVLLALCSLRFWMDGWR
jgi:hypothetical protein